MGDEKEGPYKVVTRLARGGWDRIFSVVEEQRAQHLKEIVPDAGDSQTARHICNLLNKEWRMRQAHAEMEEVQNDAAGWLAGPGMEGDGE